MPVEPNLIAYAIFSLVSLSLVALTNQRNNLSNPINEKGRGTKRNIVQDKILPVIGFDRHRSYTVAPMTVINSDVKLQKDMLTKEVVEGGITRNQDTMFKRSNNINAQKNSYSNNKYTKW
jgi:hypothetical protein